MPDRDQEFVRVDIEEFASGKPVPYAIFIRLSSWKYLQITSAGDTLDRDRLAAYKDKNVTALYLRREDFASYSGMAPAGAAETTAPGAAAPAPTAASAPSAQLKPTDPTAAEKLSHVRNSAQTTLELFRTSGLNDFLFETAKELVDSTISVLGSSDQAGLQLLAALHSQRSTNPVYDHSLAVTLYSIMIARVLGWRNSVAVFRLGLGALLHDIGTNGIDQKILAKPEAELTASDRKTLEQHPDWGAQLLKQLTNVPPEVLAIVYQHHETLTGTGYPKKISATSIHPMAKIVAVTNRFCELVFNGPLGTSLAPEPVLEQLIASKEYDPDALGALKRILKGLTS